MSDSIGFLQQILVLSREMRGRALESDWETVRVLERDRLPLIESCFPLDIAAAEAPSAREMLEEIVEMDKSILSLASAAQQEIGDHLGKVKLGRQANNAYATVGSGG
jgi:hypothetical protein